ncbi:hypothetical protein ACPESR_25185 [Nocardia testacea]|uniref:hypothetical protein n=1 Tax=Nocardia testacea TaxID=248551 RepID=UPI003C2DEA68
MTATMEDRDDMTLEQIATALGGLGVGGIATALLDRVFLRRSNRADVLDKLETISGRLTERAMRQADERIGQAEQRVRQVEAKLEEHQRDATAQDQRRRVRAELHAEWDRDVAKRLDDLGQPVGPPPELE